MGRVIADVGQKMRVRTELDLQSTNPHGWKILNLGCGTKTSPYCVNIDFSIHVRLSQSRLGSRLARLVMTGERLDKLRKLDGKILVHDLRKGIPAEDDTIDAVYDSHTLEHLDRDGKSLLS